MGREAMYSFLNDSYVMDVTNTSHINTTECPSTGESQYEHILFSIVTPILFGITTLIGIIGNTLVIYVILSKQKMRTVTNLLLLNLAFADLSFVTICPPFTAYQFATFQWPFGDIACKLMHYLLNITAYVTVYTLVLISVIRYMTIVHNAQTIRFRARNNIVVMIIAIWVVFGAINVPVLLSYGTLPLEKDDPSQGIYCDKFSDKVGQCLYATFFCFAYILPLAMVALFSILILRHIQKQRTTMLDKRTRSHNKKRQASRLLIMVVVIFALFWLPIHLHLLIAHFGNISEHPVYTSVSVLWNVLAYFNSCVNPFIYNYASKEFRDGFRDAVCCIQYRRLAQDEIHNGMTTATVMETHNKNGKSSKHLLGEKENDEEDQADDV